MSLTKSHTRITALFSLPALLVAILYFPALHFGFVWDDSEWLTKIFSFNADFMQWANYVFSTETMGVYYRPIALLSFYSPSPANPAFIWHLFNYCLYISDIFLLGMIFFKLYQQAGINHSALTNKIRIFGGMGILLFTALHPTQAETVAWISCRFDLMSNTFLLLIILIEISNIRRIYQYILQPILFLLAISCKETALVFLAIYPVLHYYAAPANSLDFFSSVKQNRGIMWLFIACALIYLLSWYQVADISAFAHRMQLNPLYDDTSSHVYLIIATIGYFFRLLFYPFIKLSPYYYHEGNIQLFDPHLWLGTIVTALVLYSLLRNSRALPIVAIILFAAFPYLNWNQVSTTGDIIQNRYLSLPLFCGSLATYIFLLRSNIPEKLLKFAFILPLYLLFMAFTSFTILPLWQNNLSLWNWVVTENPRSADAHNNLASALMLVHENDAAMVQLQASIAIKENFWAYSNIAEILWGKGDYNSANQAAIKALNYPANISDKIYFILKTANRNVSGGNNALARQLLNSLPQHYYENALFRKEYTDLTQRLNK